MEDRKMARLKCHGEEIARLTVIKREEEFGVDSPDDNSNTTVKTWSIRSDGAALRKVSSTYSIDGIAGRCPGHYTLEPWTVKRALRDNPAGLRASLLQWAGEYEKRGYATRIELRGALYSETET